MKAIMRRKIFYAAAAVFAVILIVQAARTYIARQKKSEAVVEEAVPVEVTVLRMKNIKDVLHFAGDIKAVVEVDVFPKVSGKLIANKVKEGDIVKKGTVVALIDRDVTGLKFEPFEVTSPIDGLVGIVYMDRGAGVSPPNPSPSMGTPVVKIVNMDRVKVLLNVPEMSIPKIKVGIEADVSVDAYPSRIFKGTVSVVPPVVNPRTRTAEMEISVPNPEHELQSGMFASVDLVAEEKKNVIVVPTDSLMGADGERYVYVAKGDSAQKRNVILGIRQNSDYEVTSGLSEGEMLVVTGQEMLEEGTKIKIFDEGEKK
jgi:membrane fusion protein (multidrug efflux system)